MNAISYALNHIKNNIPREILEKVFITTIRHTTTIPISVDSRIRDLIINARVFQDINIIGGTHITVPLAGLPIQYSGDNSMVVRIPKNRTQGRSITSVLSVAFGGGTTAATLSNSAILQKDDLSGAFDQMAAAIQSIPYISDAHCMLIAENVVMIQNIGTMTGNLFLRCEIENDANLNNIKRRSYLPFAQLCLLATKSYIYSNAVIPMDIGFIQGGSTMGKMQEIIESFSDSEDEYIEFLQTTWAKTSKLNDAETVERLVRVTAGGIY